MASPAYSTLEDEFWYNVSRQEDLPLAGNINLKIDLKKVYDFFQKLACSGSKDDARIVISDELIKNSSLFGDARQFLGLSDKRAYLELSYIASRIPHPSKSCSLCGCHPWTLSKHTMDFFLRLLSGAKGRDVQMATAVMVSEYLIKQGLYESAKGFATATDKLLELIYTRLIIPKEFQQKAAKRRGHGCEAALAHVLEECGVSLLPDDKATSPMGANDPHLDLETMVVRQGEDGKTHAFDLIVKANNKVRIAIQSLIHTSDPGQYGVDKSNETVIIAGGVNKWMTESGKEHPVELWGLVDGVGFCENKNKTINKLIANFDHFIQLKTLYKAPLRLNTLGIVNVKGIHFSGYYNDEDIESIVELYVDKEIKVIKKADDIEPGWRKVNAGEACIFV